jgi:hypothetical protein
MSGFPPTLARGGCPRARVRRASTDNSLTRKRWCRVCQSAVSFAFNFILGVGERVGPAEECCLLTCWFVDWLID